YVLAAPAVRFRGCGDSRARRSDAAHRMGPPGPSQAGRHSAHGRAATSAAVRTIRRLAGGSASTRPNSDVDTKGGRLCANPPVDLPGVSVAAPARMRERVHPAVAARELAGA